MTEQESLCLLGFSSMPISEKAINEAYNSKMVEIHLQYYTSSPTGQDMDNMDNPKKQLMQARDYLLSKLSPSSTSNTAQRTSQQQPVYTPQSQSQRSYPSRGYTPQRSYKSTLQDRINDLLRSFPVHPDFAKVFLAVLISLVFIAPVLLGPVKPKLNPVNKAAELTVFSNPPAEVFVDGKTMGWAPMSSAVALSPGEHELILTDKNGRRITFNKTLESKSEYRLFVNFNDNSVSFDKEKAE